MLNFGITCGWSQWLISFGIAFEYSPYNVCVGVILISSNSKVRKNVAVRQRR